MEFTGEFLKLDTPLSNGRVYRTEDVEKAILEAKESISHGTFFVTSKFSGERINLEDVVAVVKDLWIAGASDTGIFAYATVNFINTEEGIICYNLAKEEFFKLSPQAMGELNDEKEVTQLSFYGLLLTNERTF
jgi:hypothetical protein